jgi:signal peptidase II
LIIPAVLLLDQTLKIWVKTHLVLNESIKVFNWFYILFIENEGMAFGYSWGSDWGKLFLSLFRIIAVILIAFYLARIVKQKAHPGYIACIALIMAGAMGNIIDSVFYGKIFTESTGNTLATLFPPQGYANWLHGRVVDMLYFPLFQGYLPQWIPIWGGEYFTFFQPIFNVSDASITIGVLLIILFQGKFFGKGKSHQAKEENSELPFQAVNGQ